MSSPRAEAFARLGGRYETRVLEPSPPAVSEPPWFADDPAARGEVPAGRLVVSPVPTGDLTWAELAAGDEELARWCAERWLAAYRPLGPPPSTLVQTRLALHRLAEHVISPARRNANGKIALRYTRGGLGTPFFGDDVQVRVRERELIVQRGAGERTAPISTLAAAAEHIGRELLPDDIQVDDEPLDVDAAASRFLGDWYGFACSVLETLRTQAGESADPSRVQLWAEHFDLAVELGREDAGQRAGYGLSPGDEHHSEPYAYVVPWTAPKPGELWQASGFAGAELSYAELIAAAEQRKFALDFFGERLAALAG
ncbi:MAG: hypothetical protein M3018_11695 [Actinomycetota bacterium]|nr:hypothetical protein [Actinomycetota bacterium]